MDSFLYFSFIQGVFAFFAPCAVALLPAYITSFLTKENKGGTALRAIKLSALSILGIFLIYAIAGGLILTTAQLIKEYMKYIALGMGLLIIVIGILILAGKHISFTINIRQKRFKNESMEALFFGIAYATGALGCLFPLFLVVITQAASTNIIAGASYILAYFGAISTLMILTITISSFAKEFVMKQFSKILPYMERITAFLLIIAGIYIIQYQLALF